MGKMTWEDAEEVRVSPRMTQGEYESYWDYVPTCSMCDGLHGGSYCPLEDLGWADGPGHAWEMGLR